MRVELRCPGCGKGYLVEGGSTAVEFACPVCSSPVALRAPLPAAVAAPAAPPPPAAAAADEEIVCPRCNLHFSPRRHVTSNAARDRAVVLVIEDMGYFQEIARDALASRYDVKTTGSSEEGRSLLAAGGVDLLVLDLTLDGSDDGLQLLRSLRPKPCPILIYTARDESEMYGESWEVLRRLGADDMVIKGMNVGEMLLRKAGALLGDSDEGEASSG